MKKKIVFLFSSVFCFISFFSYSQNKWSADIGIGGVRALDFVKQIPEETYGYVPYNPIGYQIGGGISFTKDEKHRFRFSYSRRKHFYYLTDDIVLSQNSAIILDEYKIPFQWITRLYELSYERNLLNKAKHEFWLGSGILLERLVDQYYTFDATNGILILEQRTLKRNKLNELGSFIRFSYQYNIYEHVSIGLRSQFYFIITAPDVSHVAITPTLAINF